MKRMIGMGIGLALTSSAFAGFTTGLLPGPFNSGGAPGSVDNSIFNYAYAGPAFVPGSITLEGDLTSVIAATYASEARVRVTSPGGAVFNSLQWSATTTFTTIHIGPASQNLGAPFLATNSIGNWTFEFFEDFEDGPGADSAWTNLTMSINDFVPPPPPPATNLGTIFDTSAVYGTPDASASHTGGAIRWYQVNVPQAADNAAGTFLDIDSEGSNFDTEIGIYDSVGNLIASDDDDGTGTASQLTFGLTSPTRTIGTSVGGNGRDGTLAAGTYYVACGGFNTTFGAGFAATTTSTNTTGIFNVNFRTNIVPEPATLSLLALGCLALIRRR